MNLFKGDPLNQKIHPKKSIKIKQQKYRDVPVQG